MITGIHFLFEFCSSHILPSLFSRSSLVLPSFDIMMFSLFPITIFGIRNMFMRSDATFACEFHIFIIFIVSLSLEKI